MIEIEHLRREYNGTVALVNLNLTIPSGEAFGLIGPNGAGKTTLIRILATLLEPTYGRVVIDGVDILEDPVSAHPSIGYMSDFFSLYENMLVWEYLDHFAGCYNIPRSRRSSLIDEVLELVSLTVRKDEPAKTLSRGMRQRLCFAKTLLHEPKVLLLDEPASGLDPAGRMEFREMIKKLHEMGRTILISSHILTEMADFCTSIGILEKGELLDSGRVDDILTRLQAGLQIEIEVANGAGTLTRILESTPSVDHIRTREHQVHCRWNDDKSSLPALHRTLVQEGVDVVSFAVKSDNLEDIYMRISKHQTA